MGGNTNSVSLKHIYFLIILFGFCPNIFAQNAEELSYPKADIHIGISIAKGSYLGSIYQISDQFSFEASYGGSMGLLFLQPGEHYRIISLGANYHLRNFVLNLSYIRFEQVQTYFSHMASVNIELFSIEEPGFHLIGGLGALFEFSKHFSNKPKQAGVNFNLALGFTVL